MSLGSERPRLASRRHAQRWHLRDVRGYAGLDDLRVMLLDEQTADQPDVD